MTAYKECSDQIRHTCNYVHICLYVFDCIHVYMCNHIYMIFVWYIYICAFTYIKHTHAQYIAMFIHTHKRVHGIYVVGAGIYVFFQPAAQTTHWRYSAKSLRRAIYIRTHTHTHTNTITLSLSHTAYVAYTHTHVHSIYDVQTCRADNSLAIFSEKSPCSSGITPTPSTWSFVKGKLKTHRSQWI